MAHVEEVHTIVHEYVATAPEIVVKAGKKVRAALLRKRKGIPCRWTVNWYELLELLHRVEA